MKKPWQHRKRNRPKVVLVKPCCNLDEWTAEDGEHEAHEWYEEMPTQYRVDGAFASRIQTIMWCHCPGVTDYEPDAQVDPLNMNDEAGTPLPCRHGTSCECPPA